MNVSLIKHCTLYKCDFCLIRDLDHIKTSWWYAASSSEVECDGCDTEVLLLLELVLECGEELRVDLASKLLNVVNRFLKVLLLVTGPLLHLRVPGIDLLDGLGTKDEGSGRNLRVGVFQQERIEKGDFTQVLSEEEDLIVRRSV